MAGLGEAEKPGSLRAYKFEPLDGEFVEYQAHSLPIERIRVSFDDQNIFTVGQDGCLFIYQIIDREHRKREKEGSGLTFAEEILITKAEIEDLNKQIEHLMSTARELEIKNKVEFDMTMKEKQEEIDKLNQQIKTVAHEERAKFNALLESKAETKKQHEERIRTLQA